VSTRGGLGRIVGIGIGLAVALLLLVAAEARAGKYEVAQCGWYVGADAGWADSTGGAKFRQDAWCVPPAGQDPFDGAHLKSLTRDAASTVSGTRFARWRWEAPAGTGISQVRGTWWHALHDGMQQRIGVGTWSGGFDVFAAAASTDTTPREFVAGFNPAQPALEDRLLCAKAESKWCSLEPGSWSAIRALTITVQDDQGPGAGIGGDIAAGGWRRGAQNVSFWGGDTGAGIRFGETSVDGARVNLTEYPCAKALVGGVWKATQMRPCGLGVSGGATIDTTRFSDGRHGIHHCVTDFAGNVGCTPETTVAIDNNPPAHPRNLVLAGVEGWRRVDDFDLSWQDPDQGQGSPIAGALWRIVGPAGFDTGVRYAAGRDLTALSNLTVPAPGPYALQLWLRDEAGNDAPASALTVPLRLDNVAPGVAFEVEAGSGGGVPDQIRADVTDAHSGPAGGTILYRRVDSQVWLELPTKTQPGATPDARRLVAAMPPIGPGTYVFRADAVDVAGNSASTTRRADGTEMAVRKVAPAVTPRQKTRIFARLLRGRRLGSAVTVPFGAGAAVTGRLVRADDAGIENRELRIVSRPSRGALAGPRVDTVSTGPDGVFLAHLPAGPSRRVTVDFPGDASLDGSSRPALLLRVRGGVSLSAKPRRLSTGRVVHFGGRVRAAGAPLPRRGKLVAIQYLESATHRWRPVLVTRTDHGGRFRAHYRFRYVTGTARIELRALALPEERWPYAPGASRPLTVRVSGR
jgi:hypothetical protein